MLSFFPQLFAYQLVGLFLLRVVLGLIFLSQGYFKIVKDENRAKWQIKILGIAETAVGIMFVTGFIMQPAALLVVAMVLMSLFKTGFNERLRAKGWGFNLLLLAASLALLVSGPGIFSVDIPL